MVYDKILHESNTNVSAILMGERECPEAQSLQYPAVEMLRMRIVQLELKSKGVFLSGRPSFGSNGFDHSPR